MAFTCVESTPTRLDDCQPRRLLSPTVVRQSDQEHRDGAQIGRQLPVAKLPKRSKHHDLVRWSAPDYACFLKLSKRCVWRRFGSKGGRSLSLRSRRECAHPLEQAEVHIMTPISLCSTRRQRHTEVECSSLWSEQGNRAGNGRGSVKLVFHKTTTAAPSAYYKARFALRRLTLAKKTTGFPTGFRARTS